MFPTLSQWLAEIYICTRRLFWRNCSLIDCIVLYFSEINWFRGYFEATTYNSQVLLTHIPCFRLIRKGKRTLSAYLVVSVRLMCFLEILYEYHGAKNQPTSVL
jgi:hypothetical protein